MDWAVAQLLYLLYQLLHQCVIPLEPSIKHRSSLESKKRITFDLEDFIFGATTCPPKFVSSVDKESGEQIQCYNDDYLIWKKIDQLLTSWLMSTLSESVLRRVTQCITSCEVWLTVTNMFSQQFMARIMHLQSQLQTLKKGSRKISEYIVKIKEVADALMAAAQTIT
ncbi:hypothetical protein ACOSQ4_009385 [Xanthoceras sorbifolium]